MKLISFDVGIKNMAYCIFDTSSQNIKILDWNILNLMDEAPPTNKCTCPKNKKKDCGPCEKVAKYQKNGKFYCDKHAKTSDLLLPKKERTLTGLKKQKNADLIILGQTHAAFSSSNQMSKKELVEHLDAFFQNITLESIKTKKTKTADQMDLIQIGRNIKTKLNQVLEMENITHVLIENQISPIANRMKTIQGMLAQYFIMKNENCQIEFISSSNKLKQFTPLHNENAKTSIEDLENKLTPSNTDTYKKHKTDGIEYCSQILSSNADMFEEWVKVFESGSIKKRDDLADCFLQGIWYFRKNNLLLCAENLKIKIV